MSYIIIHNAQPHHYTTLRSFIGLTQVAHNKFLFHGTLNNTIHAFLSGRNISWSIEK